LLSRAALSVLAFLAQSALAGEPDEWLARGWTASVFAGPWSNNDSSEIFLEQQWRTDSWAIGVAGGKELIRWDAKLALETELHAVRHVAGEDHWIFAGLLVARWLQFPWNDIVETTAAIGYGPSYSTKEPPPGSEDGSQLVTGLIIELTFAEPGSSWDGFFRYQHRSSSFGLLGGEGPQDEGTGPMLGIRYSF
jgi:hypothetical protein